jgi:beta-glucanase (GH16 family)
MRRGRLAVDIVLAALTMTGCAAGGESTVGGGGKARGAGALPKPPLPGRWEPIEGLTDEFDGAKLDGVKPNDAKLDASKWHPCNPGWKGRKPGFFAKENVELRDGKLHLTARMEDRKGLPDGYHTYTTAAVKSKATVLYGYFEIKCRPMDSRASSAFWFYRNTPERWTEIDVFEIGGGAPGHEHVVHMNAHVFHTPEEKRHWSRGGKWKAPFRLAEGYHVYALEWSREELKYYVDGKPVRTMKNTHWHQPLHMNFDSETMPKWFGLPKAESLPSTFSIEYVRSWRKVGAGEAPAGE